MPDSTSRIRVIYSFETSGIAPQLTGSKGQSIGRRTASNQYRAGVGQTDLGISEMERYVAKSEQAQKKIALVQAAQNKEFTAFRVSTATTSAERNKILKEHQDAMGPVGTQLKDRALNEFREADRMLRGRRFASTQDRAGMEDEIRMWDARADAVKGNLQIDKDFSIARGINYKRDRADAIRINNEINDATTQSDKERIMAREANYKRDRAEAISQQSSMQRLDNQSIAWDETKNKRAVRAQIGALESEDKIRDKINTLKAEEAYWRPMLGQPETARKAGSALNANTMAQRDMGMLTNAESQARITETSKAMSGLNSILGINVFRSMKVAAGYMIAYAALRAMMAGVKESVSAFLEYDQAMFNLSAILQTTRRDLDATGDSFYYYATQYARSFKEVATVAQEWARQGFSAQDTNKATEASLLLSNVAMIDSGTAAKYLIAAMKEYNLTAKDLLKITDQWVALDIRNAVTTSQLAEAYTVVGSTASQYGVTMEELNAILTTIISTTQKSGSEVGQALKTMFTRIYRPETAEGLYRLTGVMTSTSRGMKSMYDILIEVGSGWDSYSITQKRAIGELFGGLRQIDKVMSALKNTGDIQKQLGIQARSSGLAMEFNKTVMESQSNQLKSVLPRFAELGKTLGLYVVPPFVLLAKAVGLVAEGLSTIVSLPNKAWHAMDDIPQGASKLTLARMEEVKKQLGKINWTDKATPGVIDSLISRALGTYASDLAMYNKDKNKYERGLLDVQMGMRPGGPGATKPEDDMDAIARMGVWADRAKALFAIYDDILKTSISDQEVLNKKSKASIFWMDDSTRAWEEQVLALKDAQGQMDAYTKSLGRMGAVVDVGLRGFAEALPQYFDMTEGKGIVAVQTAVKAARESGKSSIDELISGMNAATSAYEKFGYAQAAITELEAYGLVVESTYTKGMKEGLNIYAKYRGEISSTESKIADLNLALLDSAKKIMAATGSIKAPLVDMLDSMIKDIGSSGSAMDKFVKSIADISRKTLSTLIADTMMKSIVDFGESAAKAMQNPTQYHSAIVSAGLKVSDLWGATFDMAALKIASAISGISLTGSASRGLSANGIRNAGVVPPESASGGAQAMAMAGIGSLSASAMKAADAKKTAQRESIFDRQLNKYEQGTLLLMTTLVNTISGTAKGTYAGEGSNIGTMVGSLWGPLGMLTGSALGGVLGSLFKQNSSEEEKTREVLEDMNSKIQVSNKELNVVNRNLSAMRVMPEPYPLREQYYYRPYMFGDGPFSQSGGYSWGNAQQYAQGGKSVTVNGITFNITSNNGDEVVKKLSDFFAMKDISLFQGA